MKIVKHRVIRKDFRICHFNNIEARRPHSQNAYQCVSVVLQVGRDFDVVAGVTEDESDLGFKIARRSGEDVSLRNGTNIPVW